MSFLAGGTLCVLRLISSAMVTVGAIAANSWLYGTELCLVDRFLTNVFKNITLLNVALLCGSKLSCVLSPLSAHTRSTSTILPGLISVWVLVTISCLVSTIVYRSNVYYDTLSFQCWVDYTHRPYFGTALIVYNIAVAMVNIILTVSLLVVAKRITGTVQRKGAVAFISVSVIYTISSVPSAIRMALALQLTTWYPQLAEDRRGYCTIVASFLLYLTNFCNPILYYFSLKSFGEFVDTKVFRRTRENGGEASETRESNNTSTTGTSGNFNSRTPLIFADEEQEG